VFKPLEIHVLISRPRSAEGQPFEFGLGNILAQEMGSSIKRSKNPTTQTSTPKSLEEVIVKVMQADKNLFILQPSIPHSSFHHCF
jgi:hypothetical protein